MTGMGRSACAVAGVLLVAGIAFAGDAAKQDARSNETITHQAAGTYKASQLRTVTLTVKQVDPSNHRVTFEATVKPEANLTESGRPIKLDQLREGDTVKAAFDPKTGDVVRVDVTPGSKK